MTSVPIFRDIDMSSLTIDHWQNIFGFLSVGEVENVTEVFPESREAFVRSVFIIVKPYCHRPEYFTSKEIAQRKFCALKEAGKEAALCNWRFKVLFSSWDLCPYDTK